jgi:hypothetical protein
VEITMLASNTMNTPATTNANERLTWPEICRRYPDEWVVVVERERLDETDEADEVTIEFCTAVIVAHHKTRKEASSAVKTALECYPLVGSFFTGRLIPPAYELLVP